MRVCPKCKHRSSDRAEHCEACDYQIVLTLTKSAKVKAAPKPKPVRTSHGPRPTMVTHDEWNTFEQTLGERSLRDELAELGLL